MDEKKKGAEEAIRDGLAMAEKALALNPHMTSALLAQGSLLLARARASGAPDVRRKAARGAERGRGALRSRP
ncbi:hypothetical protein WME88_56070 [Sorangium sp. So ce216]